MNYSGSDADERAAVTKELALRVSDDHLMEIGCYQTEGLFGRSGFLSAVLLGALRGAVARADLSNRRRLGDLVLYCEHVLPKNSWGSREAVEQHHHNLNVLPMALNGGVL